MSLAHRLTFLLCLVLPLQVHANNTRPDMVGTLVGAADVSAGTSWTNVSSSGLRCSKTGSSCASGLVFSEVVIVNAHATQSLYVQFHTAASESTLNQITLAAGGSFTLPLYGQAITTLSFQGSGASTTARVVAWLVPN